MLLLIHRGGSPLSPFFCFWLLPSSLLIIISLLLHRPLRGEDRVAEEHGDGHGADAAGDGGDGGRLGGDLVKGDVPDELLAALDVLVVARRGVDADAGSGCADQSSET